MKTGIHPSIHLAGRLACLALVLGLCLAGMKTWQTASADSGGFPTDTPEPPTLIPLPTATPTFIILPTQEALAMAAEPVEEEVAAKSLADQPDTEAVQEEPAAAEESSGMGWGSLFMIGLVVGLLILGLGALVYWMLRKSRVIS
jgi:hypothetical protein